MPVHPITAWTKEEARNMLALWIEAEKAVATGQSYKIGTGRGEPVFCLAICDKKAVTWRF